MNKNLEFKEPAHEKSDLMVFRFVVLQMRIQSPLFGLQTCFFFLLKLPQGTYYMFAISKDSGETALMCRHAFAGRLCDKYPFYHVLAHICFPDIMYIVT